ncbi:MAG: hypothetical protein Q7J57_12260 [Gemmobacter sp.]|nr:hypothetical protein [Gemmobacter sp.]
MIGVLKSRLSLRSPLRRFRDDDRGFLSVEAVFVLPLLIWVFLAMFVYWDAFRSQNTHIKASYTISDMLSREQTAVTPTMINGLHGIFRFVSNTNENTWIRITHIQYVEGTDRHNVVWRYTTRSSSAPNLSNATIGEMRPQIPIMYDGDTALIVETWRNFRPAFQVGLSDRTFYQLTVVRPRFLSPMPFTS